jgi:hypothetical protein
MTPRAMSRAGWRSRFRGEAAAPAAAAPRPAIAVRVGELALRGFDPRSAPRIAASMEREMRRLIAAGLPPRWQTQGTVEALGARVRLRSMRDAPGIGEELARAVLSTQAEDRL